MPLDTKKLFFDLYECNTESKVKEVLDRYDLFDKQEYWRHYGDVESNFSTFENQQSDPVAALIEKVTNGIDAILEKRCREEGIDPTAKAAPRSVEKAVDKFFPNHTNWDITEGRAEQSKDLQIIAHGQRGEIPSLVIYDNGVGQDPKSFKDTFLSLHRGNKNKIHFVQGKYNMGGTGAVVFCGKKHRFQLIGSKYYDGRSDFGFTLVRKHTFSEEEAEDYRSTWYEYLVFGGEVPSFPTDSPLKLGLFRKKFETGSIIKLYSYNLLSFSQISRDLYRNINEYLFEPALPILTVDERFAGAHSPERSLFGLKCQLERDREDNKYVEKPFSIEIDEKPFGAVKVTCYIFRSKVGEKTAKETKQTIRREFFKSKMSVLYSLNGQVHAHDTQDFITRTLKFHFLKDHLLVHVDCTHISGEFRSQLFMASRDRFKKSDEYFLLRQKLVEVLRNSRLKDINRQRKAGIDVEDGEASKMLQDMARNLPLNEDLVKLLDQTFHLKDDRPGKGTGEVNKSRKTSKSKKNSVNRDLNFEGKRFPSIFKIKGGETTEDSLPLIQLPIGGRKKIAFLTDVEDQYFDRIDEPGELKIALLGYQRRKSPQPPNPSPPEPTHIRDLLNVEQSSPEKGEIRIITKPNEEVNVGDAIRLKASLSSPEGALECIFLVKVIKEKEKKQKTDNKEEEAPKLGIGLPKPVRVYEELREGENASSWAAMEEAGVEMNHSTVVKLAPNDEGLLEKIYVNMSSNVFLNYRGEQNKEETVAAAERKYLSAAYWHALFLYAIVKNRGYSLRREEKKEGDTSSEDMIDIDIEHFVAELFSLHYAEFLLRFDPANLIEKLEEIYS